jgi:hypothetical protein
MTVATPSSESQFSRIVLGFVLAPMLPAFYAALFFAQPWAFPIGVCLSYPAALLVGLPLFLGCRRLGWLAWWQMSLCGLLTAVPLELLYWQLGAPPHLGAFDPLNALALAGWGAFAGLSFWLLAIAGKTPITLQVFFGLGI